MNSEADFEGNCSQLNISDLTCFKFNKQHFESLFWVKIAIEVLAAVMCCLVVSLIFYFKAYKKFIFRFAIYITIAAFVNSIVFILKTLPVANTCGYNLISDETFCTIAGFMDQYSTSIIFSLMFWIALHLFVLTVFRRIYKSRKYEAGGLILSLVVPLVFSIIPFINFKNGTMYGMAGDWCYIKLTDEKCQRFKEGLIEQFTLWYGPLLFFVTVNFVAILAVTVILCRGARGPQLQQQYKEALKETAPLLFYPILFEILISMDFVNRIYYAVTLEQNNFSLWAAHAVADSCLPLFIPLSFLMHPYTLKKLNCFQLKKAARKWKNRSIQSRTHFVVSKHDTCDTSELSRLVIGGAERPTSGYQSFLEIHENS